MVNAINAFADECVHGSAAAQILINPRSFAIDVLNSIFKIPPQSSSFVINNSDIDNTRIFFTTSAKVKWVWAFVFVAVGGGFIIVKKSQVIYGQNL